MRDSRRGGGRQFLLRAALVFAGAAVLVYGAGCPKGLRMAVGRAGEPGLVTPWGPGDARVQALTAAMEAPVEMMRPEARFSMRAVSPGVFQGARDWKSLVFLLDMNQPGALARPLRRILSEGDLDGMRKQEVAFRVVRDVWALGQTVMVIHTSDPGAFVSYMRESGTGIVDAFERGLEQSLGHVVLALGEDTHMTRYLEQHHGFHITVPRDYLVAEDQQGRLVRLYRVIDPEPPRFLMVHYGPAADMPQTIEEMLRLRHALGFEYYDGDAVLFERSWGEDGQFQGRPATVLHGIWQNRKYTMGGPFRTFVFTRDDRFYMIDCSVFNPPGDKLPVLREVLALARTFRPVERT